MSDPTAADPTAADPAVSDSTVSDPTAADSAAADPNTAGNCKNNEKKIAGHLKKGKASGWPAVIIYEKKKTPSWRHLPAAVKKGSFLKGSMKSRNPCIYRIFLSAFELLSLEGKTARLLISKMLLSKCDENVNAG